MEGLSTQQAQILLNTHGENVLKETSGPSFIQKLVGQFSNPLILLLIAASLLSFFIGEPIDGGLILAIVILNALFGLYQEYKAEASLAALKKMTVTKVRVIRDGKEQEIESKYLVPGDIVYIEEGSKISADGILVRSHNLSLNESSLTGESLPVAKEKNEEVFSGTIAVHGRGYFRVEKTGMQTRFGSIASSLSNVQEQMSPLQKKLLSTSRIIGIMGLVLAAIVFTFSFFGGESYFGAFLLAVSLAVAVVPEGLPAVMTITLAIGMGEMAKRKAIVRKMNAIEALGSITVIATDKTGTLTANKMNVREVYLNTKIHLDPSFPSKETEHFRLLLHHGIVCSTASLVYVNERNSWDVLGDPTEGALLYLAQKAGLHFEDVRKEWEIKAEEPFDSVTKKMTVLAQEKKNPTSHYLFTKGASESVLSLCTHEYGENGIRVMTNERKHMIETQIAQWGEKGLRVLAFSYKKSEGKALTITDQTNMVFLGMVAIHDAPRPEAVSAVRKAQAAGIRVLMITGDNEKTAAFVGKETGIVIKGSEILTGSQIETYTDEQLMAVLPNVAVFARTTPFQKHRIVSLLQKMGEIVAVTGDGVNDAIALKQANVGIAMGLVGTDVARETADMIITDDNFSSIVQAIEEGRTIIKHLKNAIVNLLSCNVAEALTILIGLLLGVPHLLYPIQLLYINLVTDGLPALAIPFSPRDPHIMREQSNKNLVLLGSFELRYIFAVGIVSTIVVFISYYVFRQYSEEIGKTAVFVVLTLIQSFVFTHLWLGYHSVLRHVKQLFSPIYLVAFSIPFVTQYAVVSTPLLSSFFHTTPLSTLLFAEMILISLSVLVLAEGMHIVQALAKTKGK